MHATTTRGQELYRHARRRIPGGTHVFSKRPEVFLPEQWPNYFSWARGVEVWDLDGNVYTDMSHCGIGAAILGYADPDVNAAVHAAVDAGTVSTLNCPEEVELADLLCELHPWADMVRLARSGGEAMAVAIRIARASTGRDTVALCGYHGWFDWYLAANLAEDHALDGQMMPGLEPRGVPRGLRGSAVPFHYNRVEELEAIAHQHQGRLAAIVMEPVRSATPAPGFLERVREIADASGAVLIFDEITVGFRLTTGGTHLVYGVNPDIAVFAKALGNGYPISAVVGRGAVMEAAQSTFISSTNWTERLGPTAALAMLRKHQQQDVARHLIAMGERVRQGWQAAADETGLSIKISGIAPMAYVALEYANAQALHTLFTQLMLDHGFLAGPAFYAMFAHQETHVERYLAVVHEVFGVLAQAIGAGTVEAQLRGPIAHARFQRLA
jgi:glutamate-1-semialdehyde 2,1-aminomutase